METNINPNKPNNGKTMAGIIIVVIGGLLLLNQLDTFFIPHWLFSWPMWLIAYGLYLGGKYNFRKPVWLWLVVIGAGFLLSENVYHADRVVWPVAIMGTGAWMVMRHNKNNEAQYAAHDHTEI